LKISKTKLQSGYGLQKVSIEDAKLQRLIGVNL